MKKIKVGVADDYPVVLRGVESILRGASDIDVVFTAGTIVDLVECVKTQEVNVLLCDYAFEDDPGADGLHLLVKILSIAPQIKVLFLSSYSAFHVVSGALNRGAAGFIGKKTEDFAALPTAVRSVYAGNVYLPASLASAVLSNVFKSNAKGSLSEALSPRELKVIRMIFDGSTILEIAERLHRSPKTISNQKNSAMKKLAAKNDVELVKVVHDLGIFQ